MDADVIMTIGILLAVVSVPPLISTVMRDGAFSRVAFLVAVTALTVIVIATLQKPGGYQLTELPGVVISVVGRLL